MDDEPNYAKKMLVSSALMTLMSAVYFGLNWLTSLRADVGTIAWDWEQKLPFVPLMLVPYFSFHVLFLLAPLLCESVAELKAYSCQVVLATIVSALCFLILPLQMAHSRPEMSGFWGWLFDWTVGRDWPYNLCPSLHVTLTVLATSLAIRHLLLTQAVLLVAWSAVIILSTLLTYQHHAVDVLGGLILAAACQRIVPVKNVLR